MKAIGIRPDARVILLAVLVINIQVLSFAPFLVTLMASAFVLTCIATLKNTRFFVISTALLGFSAVMYFSPRALGVSWLTALLNASGYWFERFLCAILIAVYATRVLTPGQFIATLAQLRVPRQIRVPITVLVRFIPLVRQEFRAVSQASALRGIPTDAISLLTHPLRTIEYIMVPLLVSCSRIADDLTVSGLVRGLGRRNAPTTIVESRFGIFDGFILVSLGALVTLTFIMRGR